MKISIIDLDVCNVHSISKCIEHLGLKFSIAKNPSELQDSEIIIFPGIGSYPAVMKKIIKNNWINILNQKIIHEKRKYLGICLGMQILTDTGEEFISQEGLGYINGNVLNLRKIKCELVLPHTGWNSVKIKNKSSLFKDIKNGTHFYFNHTFVLNNIDEKYVTSRTEYQKEFISSIRKDNIFGVQFHPEKSSSAGIQIIKNFIFNS
jgi:glutamine amidotransferase